jgi:hypothetical protein
MYWHTFGSSLQGSGFALRTRLFVFPKMLLL